MSSSQLYLQIAIWSQVISSVAFLAALVFMWFRWLLPVFLRAQEQSNRQIAEAERHRDEVKGALEALRAEIESARHDADLIVTRAGEHAAHERQSLLGEVTQAGERAVQNAGKEFERARAAGAQRLRDELVQRALEVARADASRLVDAARDCRLIEASVGSLERANG